MKALITSENAKTNTFGWLQFEKRGIQELQKLALKAPMAMGVLLYLVNNMGRGNALAVSQGSYRQEAGNIRPCCSWCSSNTGEPQLCRGSKSRQHERLPHQQPRSMARHQGARYTVFSAEILAFEDEQPAGFDQQARLEASATAARRRKATCGQ